MSKLDGDRATAIYDALEGLQGTVHHLVPETRKAVAGHLARTLPAASAVVAVAAPPTEQTGLRDRIAAALYANDHPGHLVPLNETGMGPAYRESAGAVMAVLPPPATRAAVLRELEERYRGYARDSAHPDFRAAYAAVANDLSRLADEVQQQPEPEAHPPTHTWTVESPRRDTWASWGATYDEREWAQERCESAIEHAPQRPFRLVRATTTYVVEAEHQPDTETPDAPRREPHPTEADLCHALAVAAKFHGQAADGRCAACGHTVCDGDGPCGARSGDDFCTCPGPAASAGVQADEETSQ